MINILIIGKKGFLGSHLNRYLSEHFKVNNYSFEQVLKKENFFFQKYTHIINTCIHKRYINYKYEKKFDLDRKFIEKFQKVDFKYFFLNTRKIYFQKENITERSKISPLDVYAQNKYFTETLLKKKTQE